MQNENYCVLSCSVKAPINPASEKKPEQVFCFLLTSKEVNLLSEADFLTAEEADVLSLSDFEEIEAVLPLPVVVLSDVVPKHCQAWLPDDSEMSNAEMSDAEMSNVELSDAELYE